MLKLFKKIKKKILGVIAVTFVLGLLTTPVSAKTYSQYVWAATYDKDSWSVVSRIIATEKPKDLVAVTGTGTDLNLLSDSANFEQILPTNVYATAWPGKTGLKASDTEKAYATFVSTQLTSALNIAIANIVTDAELETFDTDDEFATFVAKVATCIIDKDSSVCDNAISGYKINVKSATQSNLDDAGIEAEGNYQGVSTNNYRVLTLKDGREILLLVSFPKGYADGQKLASTQSDATNPSMLSWKHLVAQANKSLKAGVTAYNMDELEPTDAVTGIIASLFSFIYKSIKSMLGLTGMENLILNRGTRDVVYYKGICNYSWFSAANALYWVCLVISVAVVVIGIMVSMIKKNLSLVNPEMRASLKDSLLKLAMALLFLFVFQYIFYGVVELNYLFVKALSEAAPNTTLFQNYNTSSLGGIIMLFVVLWFEVKMEITYLIRAVTIILLYISAPLFIVSIMYGNAGDKLFKTWLKELVGNIVMQSFHALILAVYLTVLKHGSASTLEKTILIYSFLPLTQFFKSKLIGDSITDGASKEATATVGGAMLAKGAIAGTMGLGAIRGAGAAISAQKEQRLAGIKESVNPTNNANSPAVSISSGEPSTAGVSTTTTNPTVNTGSFTDKIATKAGNAWGTVVDTGKDVWNAKKDISKGAIVGTLKSTPQAVTSAALSGISIGAGAVGVKGNNTLGMASKVETEETLNTYDTVFENILSNNEPLVKIDEEQQKEDSEE